MNELSVKNGYMTSSIYSDTESSTGYGISITAHRPGGQSYSEWSINNNSIYSPYFNVLEGGTNIADAFKGQLNKVNIGNNSNGILSRILVGFLTGINMLQRLLLQLNTQTSLKGLLL